MPTASWPYIYDANGRPTSNSMRTIVVIGIDTSVVQWDIGVALGVLRARGLGSIPSPLNKWLQPTLYMTGTDFIRMQATAFAELRASLPPASAPSFAPDPAPNLPLELCRRRRRRRRRRKPEASVAQRVVLPIRGVDGDDGDVVRRSTACCCLRLAWCVHGASHDALHGALHGARILHRALQLRSAACCCLRNVAASAAH